MKLSYWMKECLTMCFTLTASDFLFTTIWKVLTRCYPKSVKVTLNLGSTICAVCHLLDMPLGLVRLNSYMACIKSGQPHTKKTVIRSSLSTLPSLGCCVIEQL